MARRDGFVELSWGQPDPDLLPVDEMRRATEAALAEFGPSLLAYGAAEGPWPLLEWIHDRARTTEGLETSLDEIVGTAGNSDALDQICTLFTQPGDIALVESPTYHLALRIMRDHHLDLQPIPLDAHGLQVDVLESRLDELARAGRTPRLLYTIPTFHNPAGISLDAGRRRALVDLAVRHDILIVEDDVYRELAFDAPAPSSLFSLAPRGRVMRLGSFAKSLAPGLRLGWITCSAADAHRIADSGLRDSGGSTNFYTGMVVSALCRAGHFDRHVQRLRTEYASRRDVLTEALSAHLPPGCSFAQPEGGFFVWVQLPDTVDTATLAPHAERHKVTFVPGDPFCIDGRGTHAVRLAFSLLKPAELVDGARRLGAAIGDAAGR